MNFYNIIYFPSKIKELPHKIAFWTTQPLASTIARCYGKNRQVPMLAPSFVEPQTRHHDAAACLQAEGRVVVPGFLPAELTAALAELAREQWRQGGFRQAGIGRGEDFALRPDIRKDQVQWVEAESAPALQRLWQEELDPLRRAINAQTFLGLYDFEGHFSVYPPGAFYRRHVDQFQGARARVVSLVLYLNDNWRAADGGALRIYHTDSTAVRYTDIVPEAGTLVCFLSETTAHEVLPAYRERFSFTGWFRVRSSAL